MYLQDLNAESGVSASVMVFRLLALSVSKDELFGLCGHVHDVGSLCLSVR